MARDPALQRARVTVLARVVELVDRGGPSLRPAELYATLPLRPPPAALAAKLARRSRLSRAERAVIQSCRYWRSTQDWLGRPYAAGEEHALVLVARDIAARIAASVAWASAELDEHRVRLDLIAELDQVDARARDIADLRHRLAAIAAHPEDTHAAALAASWQALVERVAVLLLYAGRLTAQGQELTHRAEQADADLLAGRVDELVAGAVHDELAAARLHDLAEDLRYLELTNSAPWRRSAR